MKSLLNLSSIIIFLSITISAQNPLKPDSSNKIYKFSPDDFVRDSAYVFKDKVYKLPEQKIYYIQKIRPDSSITYNMPFIEPDSSIDYKMLTVTPEANLKLDRRPEGLKFRKIPDIQPNPFKENK